jgi:hypothetical protein
VGGATGAEETCISKNGCRLRPRFSLPFCVDYQCPIFSVTFCWPEFRLAFAPLAHFLAASSKTDTIAKFLFAPQDKHNNTSIIWGLFPLGKKRQSQMYQLEKRV